MPQTVTVDISAYGLETTLPSDTSSHVPGAMRDSRCVTLGTLLRDQAVRRCDWVVAICAYASDNPLGPIESPRSFLATVCFPCRSSRLWGYHPCCVPPVPE